MLPPPAIKPAKAPTAAEIRIDITHTATITPIPYRFSFFGGALSTLPSSLPYTVKFGT